MFALASMFAPACSSALMTAGLSFFLLLPCAGGAKPSLSRALTFAPFGKHRFHGGGRCRVYEFDITELLARLCPYPRPQGRRNRISNISQKAKQNAYRYKTMQQHEPYPPLTSTGTCGSHARLV